MAKRQNWPVGFRAKEILLNDRSRSPRGHSRDNLWGPSKSWRRDRPTIDARRRRKIL